MTTNDQLLTVPEVAARLGISTEGVRRRIAAGQIRAIKLGLHNSALVEEKKTPPRRGFLVGRVGIEPTTNGF
jgi:excisionase family DNA binding protein